MAFGQALRDAADAASGNRRPLRGHPAAPTEAAAPRHLPKPKPVGKNTSSSTDPVQQAPASTGGATSSRRRPPAPPIQPPSRSPSVSAPSRHGGDDHDVSPEPETPNSSTPREDEEQEEEEEELTPVSGNGSLASTNFCAMTLPRVAPASNPASASAAAGSNAGVAQSGRKRKAVTAAGPAPRPGRILLKHFSDEQQALLKLVKLYYWGLLCADGPYADSIARLKAVKEAIEWAEQERPDLEAPVWTDRHTKWVSDTICSCRTPWVDAARVAVKTHIIAPLLALKPFDQAQAIRDKVLELLTDVQFVYKDATFHDGAYAAPAIVDTVVDALFDTKDSLGIVFSHAFNPVPRPSIAFAATAVEFAIEEWKSGECNRGPFREEQSGKFTAHLQDLDEAAIKAPLGCRLLQDSLFKRGCANAKVDVAEFLPNKPRRLASAGFDGFTAV